MNTSTPKLFFVVLIMVGVCGCAMRSAPLVTSDEQSTERSTVATTQFLGDSLQSQRKLVARVLGKEIFEDDLMDPDDAAPAQDSDRKDRLEALIFAALIQKYCTDHDIEATEEEIEAARTIFGLDEQFWQEFLTHRRDALDSGELSDSQSRDTKELIAMLEKETSDRYEELYLQFYRSKVESDETSDVDKKQYAAELAMLEHESQLPAAMVKAWRFDKALYDQYGGVVIFQQMNPFEPVGAYKQFFEDSEKAGDFEILDERLHAAFWKYFKTDWFTTPWVVDDPEPLDQPWWMKGTDNTETIN